MSNIIAVRGGDPITGLSQAGSPRIPEWVRGNGLKILSETAWSSALIIS